MKDAHTTREQLGAEYTKLRTILRQAMDGFWMIDMDGNILEVNDAYCSLVGYSREELLFMRLQDVESAETSEEMAKHIRYITDAGCHRFETRHRRKDGTLVDLEASANYLNLEGGRIFALCREITERVQPEEEFRQRNRELALLSRLSQTFSATLSLDQVLAVVLFEVCQLLNVTSASIWLIDPETEELVCRQTADPRSELVHGWRLAPGEGLSGWAVQHGESLIVADAQADERHVNEVGLRTGLVLRSILTVPLRVKQEVIGALQIVDTQASRFNTTDLTVVEPVAASAAIAIENARLYEQARLEIAERKSAEMALRESETRFRVMFEYSHDLLAVADESGRAIWANPSWRETLGYTQQMQGHLFEKVHPDDYRRAMEAWSKLERGETDITNLQYRYLTTWGNYVLLETTVTRLTVAGRTYLYIAARDITKRVQAEEARQRYADRLENLHEIDLAILAVESPEAIAQATLPRLQKLVPFDQASVTVFDLEVLDATLLAVFADGDTSVGAGIQVDLDQHRIEDLAKGKVHIVEDSFALSDPAPSVQAQRSKGLRSSIAVPLIAQGELIGSLNLDKASPGAFAPGLVEIAVEVAGPLALAIQHARLFEEVRAGRERLRRLTDYLQAAREEERAHIAREIHDEFGQALTALKMDLSWITRRLPEHQTTLHQKADSMSDLIDTTIQMVRRVATELRPGLLDDLGLVTAIEWQAGEFSERTGIDCELKLGDEILDLDTDVTTVVFRILQETLTNVARHAEASLAWITLEERPEELVLTVSDNGKGITPKQIADPGSLGLIGMRERARSSGGDVKFQAIPGEGTRVTLRVPKVYKEEDRE